MHKCITTQIDSPLPDLFTTSQSPSYSDLCHFKVAGFIDTAALLVVINLSGVKNYHDGHYLLGPTLTDESHTHVLSFDFAEIL
jgi:hypothetical protein